jgi:hypothetical protein
MLPFPWKYYIYDIYKWMLSGVYTIFAYTVTKGLPPHVITLITMMLLL